ncbi:unnamed protein product [Camellia sinensis]
MPKSTTFPTPLPTIVQKNCLVPDDLLNGFCFQHTEKSLGVLLFIQMGERTSERQKGGNTSRCRYARKLCRRWDKATDLDGFALHAELPNGASQDVRSCQNARRRWVGREVRRVVEGGDVSARVGQYPLHSQPLSRRIV